MRNLYLVLLLSVAFFGCETEEIREFPALADQFIELELGDRNITLVAYLGPNTYTSSPEDVLELGMRSTDGIHEIQLKLMDSNLPNLLLPKAYGEVIGEEQAHLVSVIYTTYELNNSNPYCPHLEGQPTELTGSLTVTSWTESGLMTGTFQSTEHESYQLTGTFQIEVSKP